VKSTPNVPLLWKNSTSICEGPIKVLGKDGDWKCRIFFTPQSRNHVSSKPCGFAAEECNKIQEKNMKKLENIINNKTVYSPTELNLERLIFLYYTNLSILINKFVCVCIMLIK